MSRYTIPHASYRIVVGWDNPLETFFVQVSRLLEDKTGVDTDVLWVGTDSKALLSVESVRYWLRPYAVLPDEIAGHLQRDFDSRTAPSPLQRHVWAFIDRR